MIEEAWIVSEETGVRYRSGMGGMASALRFAAAQRSPAGAYLVSIVAVALAFAATEALRPVVANTLGLFLLGGVMIAGWHGGFWPGLLATGLSLVALENLMPGPPGSHWRESLALSLFATVSIIISSLNALRQNAESELRRQQSLLEDRVDERTRQLTRLNQSLQVQVIERIRAEETLRDSEDRFRILFEEAPVAYHEVDRQGIVSRVNRADCELLGRTPEEILGRPVWELISPEQRELSRASVTGKLRTVQQIPSYIREFSRPDGTRVSVEIHERQILDRTGEVIGLRSTLLNVTERIRAEEHIRTLNAELERRVQERTAELERSNSALQQFAYSASHDLQEPLRMISSYTQLLARRLSGRLDPDSREFIEYIVEGSERMSHLIRDLLDFSRAGQDRGQRNEAIDFSSILHTAIRNLEAAFEESGAVLTAGPLPRVQARDAGLGQVLQNLIGNAIKYRREIAPRIHVSAEKQGREWIFCIADNGIGFDPQFCQRIFGVFKRLHGRQYPGTGIGLAICKRIVESSGGRIWAESEVDKGSKFYFTIPEAVMVSSVNPQEVAVNG